MKQIINNFNKYIKNTIFKVQNKTNAKFPISKFNKYLITFISLLFFYLFYLSLPVFYDKNWVQNNVESQMLRDFRINFSTSSNISYRILPKPHFLIKDSKIFRQKEDKSVSLADIKDLRIFISQKNLFNSEKMTIKKLKIDNANFLIKRDDFELLKKNTNYKFFEKKIEIRKSNIFFSDNSGEVVTIIKILEAFLFHDDKNILNLLNLKGEVFNIPFNLDYNKKFDSLNTEEIEIIAKTLKLNIFNITSKETGKINAGTNTISFLNSKFNTNYKVKDDVVIFNSSNSRAKINKANYNGELSINPFDLNLDINLGEYDLHSILNNNSILSEIIKTELMFNQNISMRVSVSSTFNSKKKIFQNAKINFNINDGKLNIDKTRLINKKIGFIEINNSNLSYKENKLILNADVLVKITNPNKLFSLLQTNKKFRKPINNILINLDYDFLSKKIDFNNIKINNQEIDDVSQRIIEDFTDNKFNNWHKSRRIINTFLENYDG